MAKAEAKKEGLSRKRLSDILEQIEAKHGSLTPAAVVQEAAKENHPLHNEFEWDDRKAAAIQRLNTARALIRSIRVTIQVDSVRLRHSSYIHDPSLAPGQQGYAQVLRIKTEADLAVEALEAEVSRAEGALRRAHGLAIGLGDPEEAERISSALAALGRQ